jgi:hypothetical protein
MYVLVISGPNRLFVFVKRASIFYDEKGVAMVWGRGQGKKTHPTKPSHHEKKGKRK